MSEKVSFDDFLVNQLKDPKVAAAYWRSRAEYLQKELEILNKKYEDLLKEVLS